MKLLHVIITWIRLLDLYSYILEDSLWMTPLFHTCYEFILLYFINWIVSSYIDQIFQLFNF
jgi:hypothetical protein